MHDRVSLTPPSPHINSNTKYFMFLSRMHTHLPSLLTNLAGFGIWCKGPSPSTPGPEARTGKILYGNNIELKIYILKIFCEEGIFRKNFQSSSKVPQRSSVDLYSPATETVTTWQLNPQNERWQHGTIGQLAMGYSKTMIGNQTPRHSPKTPPGSTIPPPDDHTYISNPTTPLSRL